MTITSNTDRAVGSSGATRRTVAMAWVAAVLSVLIAMALGAVSVLDSASLGAALSELSWTLIGPMFAVTGVVIVSRYSDNRIGWLMVAIGVFHVLGTADEVLVARIDGPPQSVNLGLYLAVWYNNWAWITWLLPMFLLVYIFPTGRLPSRRWRWVPRLSGAMVVIMLFLATFASVLGPNNDAWSVPNPIGFISDGAIRLIEPPWLLALLVLAISGAVAMILRWRTSSKTERAQIEWVLVAGVLFAAAYAFAMSYQVWVSESVLPSLVLLVGVAAVPFSIAVAIFRFHLYDIDVIISRSLTFGVLVVFIGAVYVGIVVGIGSLFDQGGRSNLGLSVTATAVVALAFQPVRNRVERRANRLVYGERATPYEVLARFSRRASEESDDDVLARIPRLIVDGTGASEAALWVRSGGGFRTVSMWPDPTSERDLGEGAAFEDPESDLSLPVVHDGELLGGISLVAARGVAITPPDRELLTSLADGLGLTLRNSQLTTALKRQVDDLQRSRDRVMSAADDARRSLEHDLDSGPQQQLVAVKVKLGPLRKLAEQAGATRTAELLSGIEAQAGEAIRTVRDFAAGIYPPLLGAEGLAVALGQEVRKAALPVELEVDGLGRYPRDVEAAVYFSVLEALQNTAKYAQASRAVVRLSKRYGDLRFEVADDGLGFDTAAGGRGAGLNGIADRMDTVGGTWDVASTVGEGTVVTGSVPVREILLS